MCCAPADKGPEADFEKTIKKKRRGARGTDGPIQSTTAEPEQEKSEPVGHRESQDISTEANNSIVRDGEPKEQGNSGNPSAASDLKVVYDKEAQSESLIKAEPGQGGPKIAGQVVEEEKKQSSQIDRAGLAFSEENDEAERQRLMAKDTKAAKEDKRNRFLSLVQVVKSPKEPIELIEEYLKSFSKYRFLKNQEELSEAEAII